MGFTMPPVLIRVALVCALVGLIMQIVGLATPVWIVSPTGFSGLWKVCQLIICTKIPDSHVTGQLEAARAFGILGVLVMAGCFVVGIMICFMEKPLLNLVAAILGFVAGLCILVEFAVLAGSDASTAGTIWGYSFFMTIAAFVLSLAAGSLFLAAKLKA